MGVAPGELDSSSTPAWTSRVRRWSSAGGSDDLGHEHFNDRAESVRVPRGQQWEVCVDAKFNNCRVVDHDIRDLAAEGLNRNISSVRLHRGR